jgi:hypothetical protein
MSLEPLDKPVAKNWQANEAVRIDRKAEEWIAIFCALFAILTTAAVSLIPTRIESVANRLRVGMTTAECEAALSPEVRCPSISFYRPKFAMFLRQGVVLHFADYRLTNWKVTETP